MSVGCVLKVEIAAQNHERDVARKDAILQMLDRDLDESEEQHQVEKTTFVFLHPHLPKKARTAALNKRNFACLI